MAKEFVPTRKNASSYGLVVIGTPVWAGSVASPVRAYLVANKSKLRQVAFFCSLGGRGSESAFAQMRVLAGSAPVAHCKITAREAKHGEASQLLGDFVSKLERTLAGHKGRARSPC